MRSIQHISAFSVALSLLFPSVLYAAPYFVAFNTSQPSANSSSFFQTNRLYSVIGGTIAPVPDIPDVEGFRFNSISFSPLEGFLFSSNIDGIAGEMLASTETLTRFVGGQFSNEASVGDFTTSAQPKISAISRRGQRLFLSFSSWLETETESHAPWQILELANNTLEPFLDLADFGVPRTTRIRGLSVFPAQSIYASFTTAFEANGDVFSPDKVYRLDLSSGRWSEDRTLCTVELGCFADSVADFEVSEDSFLIFSSRFEG